MRVKDELRKAVQALDLGEALQSDKVVAAVLDKLIDRLDSKSDYENTYDWLRAVRDGSR